MTVQESANTPCAVRENHAAIQVQTRTQSPVQKHADNFLHGSPNKTSPNSWAVRLHESSGDRFIQGSKQDPRLLYFQFLYSLRKCGYQETCCYGCVGVERQKGPMLKRHSALRKITEKKKWKVCELQETEGWREFLWITKHKLTVKEILGQLLRR